MSFLLQFTCDPKDLFKIKNLLERCEYNVISVVDYYVPRTVIELSESDLEAVSRIRERVLSLGDVNEIYDNTP